MEFWLQIIVTILTSVLASSGLWAFLSTHVEKSSAEKDIIVGIAHVEILFFGTRYLERGYITREEYTTLYTCLYEPYKKLGGNGSAEKIMSEVNKLPIKVGFSGEERDE